MGGLRAEHRVGNPRFPFLIQRSSLVYISSCFYLSAIATLTSWRTISCILFLFWDDEAKNKIVMCLHGNYHYHSPAASDRVVESYALSGVKRAA